MALRIAINGFGRMGRLVLRAGWGTPGIDFVHINEIKGGVECAAHLLEYDTVQGRWNPGIGFGEDRLVIDGKTIGYSEKPAPNDLDWAALGVDLVLECTGKFRTAESLGGYFARGVGKVLVAAPVKSDAALNLVYGVNHHLYRPDQHHLLTAASCTTNCLAPIVKVIHENIGIVRGSITTIHDVTNTQVMVDAPHKDLRRARSGLNALIPTTTGSATAITLIYPELKGRLDGHAVRVPTLNGSLTDCVFELAHETSAEAVNGLFRQAADGTLRGILGFEEKPLVSSDFVGNPLSVTIDGPSTLVVDGTHLKVYAWYDNEWGYVNRMMDIVRLIDAG
ncbi:MAG: ArsJ-associated glyceraldehyde-3-phosphate dehydrogenase [Rhodospirillales bacterium]|nr:ArsJ-associated glyceraldehyde-3-phosphate dehydrogenase [Rhodospirillales bacterium]